MPLIQSNMEWTVVISRFESFNKFYVQKVKNENSSASVKSNNLSASIITEESKDLIQRPLVGSIIETLTDKADDVWYKAEVMAIHDDTNIIVRVLNDGSICKATKIKNLPDNGEKLVYHCCLEEDSENDDLINDPFNFNIISNIMTSREWIMKTSCDREPYIVTLSINGEDCFDVICKSLPPPDNENTENSNLLLSVDGPEDKDALIVQEKPKNDAIKKNCIENDLVVPDSEAVIIKSIETFKYFYAKSECLYTLYMERINAELKMCKTQKPLIKTTVGSIVVALCKSLNQCYRVLVESITSHGTNCYLIDYGEYDVYREFYKPTDFLCKCPPIVRRCSLCAPKLAGKEDEIWFPDVDDMFKDIVTIEGIKFDMTIREYGSWQDPCVVSLMLQNIDISEMLCPINVRVTYVNSLTNFKINAVSNEQKAVAKLLESENFPKVVVSNPVHGSLYLAITESKFIRVKFESFGGLKYVVIDIDDTLDKYSVDQLYEIPESISNIPTFTMACSLILHDDEDAYSLDAFKHLVNEKVVFVMSIINENDGTKPSPVKLYYAHKDVLSILRS